MIHEKASEIKFNVALSDSYTLRLIADSKVKWVENDGCDPSITPEQAGESDAPEVWLTTKRDARKTWWLVERDGGSTDAWRVDTTSGGTDKLLGALSYFAWQNKITVSIGKPEKTTDKRGRVEVTSSITIRKVVKKQKK